MRQKGKCSEEDEYQIDQANLIRNLNDELMNIIVNPNKNIVFQKIILLYF